MSPPLALPDEKILQFLNTVFERRRVYFNQKTGVYFSDQAGGYHDELTFAGQTCGMYIGQACGVIRCAITPYGG